MYIDTESCRKYGKLWFSILSLFCVLSMFSVFQGERVMTITRMMEFDFIFSVGA